MAGKSENVEDLPEDLKRLLENPGSITPEELSKRLATDGYCTYAAGHYTGQGTQTCTSSQCIRFNEHTGQHQCFYGHNFN